jgi:hypothetical protein
MIVYIQIKSYFSSFEIMIAIYLNRFYSGIFISYSFVVIKSVKLLKNSNNGLFSRWFILLNS